MCNMIADVVESDKQTEAYLLDYGCGTGLVAEYLVKEYGFKTVDWLEPNQGLLDGAHIKGTMRNLYQIGSNNDDHSELGEKKYDVLTSFDVFFVSLSHPDLPCLEKLCTLVKKGKRYILICSGDLNMKYVDMGPADRLVKENKIFLKGLSKNNLSRSDGSFLIDIAEKQHVTKEVTLCMVQFSNIKFFDNRVVFFWLFFSWFIF